MSTEHLLQTLSKLEGDVALEARREVLRSTYRHSLYATAKFLLGYEAVAPHTHSKLIAHLEAATRRKLLVMPRGTFKTSIAGVAYPIWLLLNNPNLRILLDSELYTNSKNMLREIKDHVSKPQFTDLFGDWSKCSTWNEGEIIIAARNKVKKEASITCSGIGAQKTGQHYDIIIADDMNSPKNSGTPEACEKVVNHYKFYTSLAEPEGSTIVVIGTRYSSNDLIGWILQNELGIDEAKACLGD